MAVYSGKALVQKIGLKPGHRIALAGEPDGFIHELDPVLPQRLTGAVVGPASRVVLNGTGALELSPIC